MNQSILSVIGARSSSPKLTEPGPNKEELNAILAASINVPDHLRLKPWRFLTISGDALEQLGDLFAEALKIKQANCSDEDLLKRKSKALRAPLIIVGISKNIPHDKVPVFEQQASTACVIHNIGLCLFSMGYGSVWRTGAFASDRHICNKLGLEKNEEIVGYLYIGTPESNYNTRPKLEVDQHISSWPKP